MSRITHIIIANDAESFEHIIGRIDNRADRLAKLRKEHFVCGRFVLWEGDNKLVITPYRIAPHLLTHYRALGYTNISNKAPRRIGLSLSDSIVRDGKLFQHIVSTIKANPGLTISPYAYTEHFRALIDHLRRRRLPFKVDIEPLQKSCWLVAYLGSKIGFRIENLRGQKASSPAFFLCCSKADVLHAVEWFTSRRQSCVAKVIDGEGGWGTLMLVGQTSLRSKISRIEQLLERDPIWKSGPYIVEEYLGNHSENSSSPSVEAVIDLKGRARITYVCEQVVDRRGRYLGAVIGKSGLQRRLTRRLRNITRRIAQRYSVLGYRGFFDVDFVVRNGRPFAVETNVRRTGGTHVYDCARFLFGRAWIKKYIFSCDCYTYSARPLTAHAALERLRDSVISSERKHEGIVITGIDSSTPRIGFIIIANTRTKAYRIRKTVTGLLNS